MPDATVPNTRSTALASYIAQEVFDVMRQNREPLEKKWNECRDAFQGVITGRWKVDEASGLRSQTFVNETRQKVMAAYSILIDTLLTGGRIPFMLSPSPWDNIVIEDLPVDEQDRIRDSIEDMTSLIQQQLRDCNADRALMKAVLSLCEYGETVAKKTVISVVRKGFKRVAIPQTEGPVSDFSRVPMELNLFERSEDSHDSPAWEYVSIWDVFRDMETDDLRGGYGVIHRTFVSPYWLRIKKGEFLFDDTALEEAISVASKQDNAKLESADQNTLPPYMRDVQTHKRTIQYLEFWGRLPKAKVEEYEAYLMEQNAGIDTYELPTIAFDINPDEENGDEIECMVCVAGGNVVRFARTQPDQRPFFRAMFEENLDELGARGIAENVSDMQEVLNGVFRAIEDNMKLSGNVIIATIDDMIQGKFDKVVPGQRIHLQPEAMQSNVDPVKSIIIPNVTAPLMELYAMVRNNLDEESMVPRTLQGIQIDKGQDTAYEISQRVERAGKYLAAVIRNIDEGLIKPIITEMYEYDMMDPATDAGKKGNYVVKALGFTSYQDRVVRIQNLKTMIEIAMQVEPIQAEMEWRKITEDMAKSLDLDIDQNLKSRQDKDRENANKPPDPMIEKTMADADKARAEAEATRASIKLDAAELQVKIAAQSAKTMESEAKVAGSQSAEPKPGDDSMAAEKKPIVAES